MRPDGIVTAPPSLDQHLRLAEFRDVLPVQHLKTQIGRKTTPKFFSISALRMTTAFGGFVYGR
jgi:hypothetical protein